MLKLKLQYFGHLMRRVDSLERTDAGRDWGQEEKGRRVGKSRPEPSSHPATEAAMPATASLLGKWYFKSI